MPSPIYRAARPRTILVPAGLAERIAPGSVVPPPVRVSLGQEAPPYAGEICESQFSGPPSTQPLAVGERMVLCTLRRAWNFVGWLINPGNAASGGPGTNLLGALQVIGRGMTGLLTNGGAVVQLPPFGPNGLSGIIVGQRCELVVINATAAPVTGLQGMIWGMGEM